MCPARHAARGAGPLPCAGGAAMYRLCRLSRLSPVSLSPLLSPVPLSPLRARAALPPGPRRARAKVREGSGAASDRPDRSSSASCRCLSVLFHLHAPSLIPRGNNQSRLWRVSVGALCTCWWGHWRCELSAG